MYVVQTPGLSTNLSAKHPQYSVFLCVPYTHLSVTVNASVGTVSCNIFPRYWDKEQTVLFKHFILSRWTSKWLERFKSANCLRFFW
ncbi:hypothetical protein AB205_0111230 [Aquarana catesbeiana]|uniref:Uncharacterized protein n=1 Tax=Aquarana catesbeiana TaxID=8400 RepID=A0A2G9RXT0_AQUCT|nr:hypothetical protein AB205_0111230 [Aquarana catesbeiana]